MSPMSPTTMSSKYYPKREDEENCKKKSSVDDSHLNIIDCNQVVKMISRVIYIKKINGDDQNSKRKNIYWIKLRQFKISGPK